MTTHSRARIMAIGLSFLAMAGGLRADPGMGICVSAGLNPVLPYYDPGLDAVVDIYNDAHPTLADPMNHIRSMMGLTINGGFLFSLEPRLFMADIDMGWSGLTGETTASNGTDTRRLQISLNTFQSSFSVLFTVIPDWIFVGPSIGMQVGDVAGKTKFNNEAWVDLSDGPLMGWDFGAKAWIRLRAFPYLLISIRPWYRIMSGITGYSDINDALNGYYPPNLFESDLGAFGVQVEAMVSIYLGA